MRDRFLSRSDRRLAAAILVASLLGLSSIAIGAWLLANPAGWMTDKARNAPIGAIIAGLIFLGIAVYELAHRLRHGQQPPGRHTRSGRRAGD